MTEKREKKDKFLNVRVSESLLNLLQKKAKLMQISLSRYVNFVLNSSIKKHEVPFDEKIGQYEEKDIKSRIYFTASEMELLKQHTLLNDWSITKEVRYRIVSSLAKKPKLNKEELKAIYSVRSSINVLGVNINRLVRDRELLSDNNIEVCKELITLMKELTDKISYLEKCSYSNFKLKNVSDVSGR